MTDTTDVNDDELNCEDDYAIAAGETLCDAEGTEFVVVMDMEGYAELRRVDGNDVTDDDRVEHGGMIEDDDGTEYVVLVDHRGYGEVRAADDDRWGQDWRDY